jgi:hypothetical protein
MYGILIGTSTGIWPHSWQDREGGETTARWGSGSHVLRIKAVLFNMWSAYLGWYAKLFGNKYFSEFSVKNVTEFVKMYLIGKGNIYEILINLNWKNVILFGR